MTTQQNEQQMREAMRKALAALESCDKDAPGEGWGMYYNDRMVAEAIAAIETALTASVSASVEPVAQRMADSLFHAIQHGDADHRAWLRAKSVEWATSYLAVAAVPVDAAPVAQDGADVGCRNVHGSHHCRDECQRPLLCTLKNSRAAPAVVAEPPACPCKLPTCVEPWEPGCGLGLSEEHARIVAEPAIPDGRPSIDGEALRYAIAEALGGAMDCMRVWSAWRVGTMSEDDFSSVAENAERVDEIACAVEAVIAAAPKPEKPTP